MSELHYSWDKIDLQVEVVSVENLPDRCCEYFAHGLKANNSLRIHVDDIEMGKWHLGSEFLKKSTERRFNCTINKFCLIRIEITCEHRQRSSHIIASLKGKKTLDVLPWNSVAEITVPRVKTGNASEIKLSLKVSHIMTAKQQNEVTNSLVKPRCRSRYTIDDLKSMGIVSRVFERDLELQCPEWINLLGSLGRLGQIVKEVCDLDPKAKAALTTISVAFELFQEQKLRDERILGLVEMMSYLYQMILDSEPLEKCQTLRESIDRLINLTRECAYFISDYTSPGSFSRRMLVNVVNVTSPVDDLINQFEKSFVSFKESFFTGITLDAARVTIRVWEKLQDMDEKIDEIQLQLHKSTIRSHFPNVYGIFWDINLACLPGTRIPLLNEIYAWGNSYDKKSSVFLLSGVHGSGKSTVAHSVAAYFHDQGRLGSAIFMDKQFNEGRLVSSLIRDLTIYDKRLAKKIALRLDTNPRIANGAPDIWFERLVVQPLRDTPFVGPIVIIIDGIAEANCEDSFIELLVQLPAPIRLFITSSDSNLIRKLTRFQHINYRQISSYLHGYLETFKNIQPIIFSTHSLETAYNVISELCRDAYYLAYIICKLMAFLPADGAIYFVSLICDSVRGSGGRPSIETLFASLMSTSNFYIVMDCLFGLWPSHLSEITMKLIEDGFLHADDSGTHAIFIKSYISFLLNKINQHISLPLHWMWMSRYVSLVYWNNSKLSQLYKNAQIFNQNTIVQMMPYLICRLCQSKAPLESLPVSFDVEMQRYLDCPALKPAKFPGGMIEFQGHSSSNDFASQHLFLLTSPIELSESKHPAGRISAVRFTLESNDQGFTFDPPPFHGPYHRSRTWFEAAIFRTTSVEGGQFLQATEHALKKGKKIALKDMTKIHGVSTVLHPLSGRGAWELQRNACAQGKMRKHSILWFNVPIEDIKNKRNDDNPDENGEGQGVGFSNSLLPGDRIAIIACTSERGWVNRVYSASVGVLYSKHSKAEVDLGCKLFEYYSRTLSEQRYSEAPATTGPDRG